MVRAVHRSCAHIVYSFFGKTLDILHVFIPQLLFLSLLFIYLCLLIVGKWINFGVFPMDTS